MSLGSKLHVVTAISNPARYKSRYELYRQFEERMLQAGVNLWTVEAAFGTRPHAITNTTNPRHIQVRTSHELWHKENLLNIGISRLPSDWEYMAWVDADFLFARHDWAEETVHQLQHTPVVQMYSELTYLSPTHEALTRGPSFMESWMRGAAFQTPKGQVGNRLFYHPKQLPYDEAAKGSPLMGPPGGAWAYTRRAFDAIGGLIDYSLVGGGDHFMGSGSV